MSEDSNLPPLTAKAADTVYTIGHAVGYSISKAASSVLVMFVTMPVYLVFLLILNDYFGAFEYVGWSKLNLGQMLLIAVLMGIVN